MATVDELNAELLQYQQALAEITSGNRVTEMVVGSGATQRKYKYQDINEEFIRSEIARLKGELLTAQSQTPTYRASSVMYTTYGKQ